MGHLELENLLYKFQCCDRSAGWDVYPFLKDDVQGINCFLFGKHENKGAAVKGTARQLFEGHPVICIECIHVDKSGGKETFNGVHRAISALVNKYAEVEHQEGDDSKYHAENLVLQYCLVEWISILISHDGRKFFNFPPVLQKEDTIFKINGLDYSQPYLDRDGGKYLAPDLDRSIRNLYALHKCKFNNERIAKEDTKKGLEDRYVFVDKFGHLWEVSTKTHNAEAKLFRESEHGQDLLPLPPEKSKENIIIFKLRKLKEEVCFVGTLFINGSWKPSGILRKLNEMNGFTPYEETKLHETMVKIDRKLQLCEYFCRSSSSSKRPIFAPVKSCSIILIMNLQSPAAHLKKLCSIVFSVLPKVLTSPGLLNKFQKDEQVGPQLEITSNLPELPREILMDIFTLLEIPDLVRAGSVCSSWNSAYASIRSIGQSNKQQTPCLLYTSESAGEKVAHLYSLAEKRVYKLTLPEPPIQRRYLIGSSHGMLVTVDERSEMHLVNPLTSEQIALPSVITIEQVTPIYDDTGAICKYSFSWHATQPATRRPLTVTLSKLRDYLHHKALVFYDMSAGNYIVVLICSPLRQLLFARIGDEKWTQLPSHTHVQDCIYKNGVLYAVTSFGEVIAIDLSGAALSTKTILDRVRNHYGSHRVYIAEAPWGDLLQIWRPEVWIEEVDGQQHEATFQNKAGRMEIYKVCTAMKKLVQIDSLDGHVLFLGNNQSLCSRVEDHPQLKSNHVYFTDDVEGVAYSFERGYRLNIGVLNFGNKSVEEIIFPRPWSNCLTPLLIIPNLRKMDSALHS